MKILLKLLFTLLTLISFNSCITKSDFDTFHTAYYNLPWDFTITVTPYGSDSLSVNWGNSYNAISYTIKYKNQSDASYNTVSTSASSPYIISGLISGQTYQIYVEAFGTNGSTKSNIESILLNSPPPFDDQNVPHYVSGSTHSVVLSYTDSEGDLSNSCSVFGENKLSFNGACSCNDGICSIRVTGEIGYAGVSSFNFTLKANSQESDPATIFLIFDP